MIRSSLLVLCLSSSMAFAAAPLPASDPLPTGAIRRIGTTRLRHGGLVRSLAFSADGSLLASASHDRTVSIWDVSTGKERFRLTGHEDDVVCLAFTPDTKQLLTGSLDGTLRFWNLTGKQEGKEVKSIDLKREILCLAYSPTGKQLAVGTADGTLRLYDPAATKAAHTLTQDREFRCLAWSADGKVLATNAAKKSITVWDPQKGKPVDTFGTDPVHALAFSRKGQTLATWEAGGLMRLWDSAKGKQIRQWSGGVDTTSGPAALIYQIAFSQDDRNLLVGTTSGFVDIWDVQKGKRLKRLSGHQARVASLALSKKGVLATGSADHTIRLWDVSRGHELVATGDVNAPWVNLSLPRGGKVVAVLTALGQVRLFEAATGKPVKMPALTEATSAVAINPSGTVVVVGTRKNKLLWLDLSAGKTKALDSPDGALTLSLAFSADGKTLVSAGSDGQLAIRDDKGKILRKCKGRLRRASVVVSGNGRILAGVSGQATVQLWDATTGESLDQLRGHRGGTIVADFAADDRLLFTGGRDRLARSWEICSAQERIAAAKETGWVNACATSLDGRLVATGTTQGTIVVRAARTGQVLARYAGHRGRVTGLAFAHGGRVLISSGLDTTLLFWNTEKLEGKKTQPQALTTAQASELFKELGNEEAAKAATAMEKLILSPDSALPVLRRMLVAVDETLIKAHLKNLDSDNFGVYEKAELALKGLGRFAVPYLQQVLKKKPSLDQVKRIERLLGRMTGPTATQDYLRVLRSIEVLERIGTPGAKQVLTRLSLGAPLSGATSEAKLALGRLPR